ncbi:MAG: nitrite reductase/ring-hydroxylating ferredoxin subunit [Cyclobacteriaceae bacterium]|jgi:nitrite reductase/ring-hydroxylating ferredoxin subunit
MSETLIIGQYSKLIKIVANRQIRQVDIGQNTYCLIRIEHNFFLTERRCPHMDQNLVEGAINFDGQIICPWHSYAFSLPKGQEAEHRCRNLKSVQLTLVDDNLVVDLVSLF